MPAYFDSCRTHVFKCSSVSVPDRYQRRFIDQRGRQLHLEQILGHRPEQGAWEEWQEYRAEDAAFFDNLKRQNLKAAKK